MSGITTQIRQKLNFHDGNRWKRFSARRFHLIEENQLYLKKASDQELEVRKVANVLLTEFDIPNDKLDDVERLVCAAIQSVRRNRKRARNGKSKMILSAAMGSSDSGNSSSSSVVTSVFAGQETVPIKKWVNVGGDNSSFMIVESGTPNLKKMVDSNDSFINEFVNVPNNAEHSEEDSRSYSKTRTITSSDEARSVIGKLIQPDLNNAAQSLEQKPQSPTDYTMLIRNRSIHGKKTLMGLIRKSKTCTLSTRDTLIVDKESSIYHLGKSTFPTIISYWLCKTNDTLNNNSSIEYLRLKLNSVKTLAKLFKCLNLDNRPEIESMDDETARDTLYYLVGCCIVDFKFDEIIEQFNKILDEFLVDNFPLIGSSVLANRSRVSANDDNEIQVVEIKFKDKSLKFTFNSKVSATPTISEIITNCKDAFEISSTKAIVLKDTKSGDTIGRDQQLEHIFENSQENISIEMLLLEDVEIKSRLISPLEWNPYRIKSLQSYDRSSSRKQFVAPKFEKLL